MSYTNPLRLTYQALERQILILIAIPLPLFSFAYLYTTSPTVTLNIPQLPQLVNSLLIGAVILLIGLQLILFDREIGRIRRTDMDIESKFGAYASAVIQRFWLLFFAGIFSAVGQLLFENPAFTIAYAVCLVFVSLGKPTPFRIARQLRLRDKEKEMVIEINRREP